MISDVISKGCMTVWWRNRVRHAATFSWFSSIKNDPTGLRSEKLKLKGKKRTTKTFCISIDIVLLELLVYLLLYFLHILLFSVSFLHQTKTVGRKRLCFLLFFTCRRIYEYISLELFCFFNLTSSCSLIPQYWYIKRHETCRRRNLPIFLCFKGKSRWRKDSGWPKLESFVHLYSPLRFRAGRELFQTSTTETQAKQELILPIPVSEIHTFTICVCGWVGGWWVGECVCKRPGH